MSFADNVRKNYNPVPTPKNDPDIYKRVAEEQFNRVKEDLMRSAKRGSTHHHPNDFLAGIGKKVIDTIAQVHVDPMCRQVRNSTWDGEICNGIEVPNKIKMHMVYNELVRLCRNDGINVKIKHDLKWGLPYFYFWIDV